MDGNNSQYRYMFPRGVLSMGSAGAEDLSLKEKAIAVAMDDDCKRERLRSSAPRERATLVNMYRYRFLKSSRLLTSRDFQGPRKGKSLVGKWLVLEVAPSSAGRLRLGLAASKRYGKAHLRNRFKRLVREAFRHLDLKENLDIVVRPRKQALKASYQDIADEISALLKKC